VALPDPGFAHPQIQPAAKKGALAVRHEVGRNSGKETKMTDSGTPHVADVDNYTSLRIIIA